MMRAAATYGVDVRQQPLTSLLTAQSADTLRTFHQLQMVGDILQDVHSWHHEAEWAAVLALNRAALRLVPFAAL